MAIVINLDVELAKRKMSVTDLAAAIDLAVANVSILKNGRAKAVRFTTLDAICSVLDCQPGDILTYVPDE
jgi:putative transcriptional regulator